MVKVRGIYSKLDNIIDENSKGWLSIPVCTCSDSSVTYLSLSKTYGCNNCGMRWDKDKNKNTHYRK